MKNVEIGEGRCLVLNSLIDLCHPNLIRVYPSIPGYGLGCLSGSIQHVLKIGVSCGCMLG